MKTLNREQFVVLLTTRNRTEPVTIVTRTTDFMNTGGRKDKNTGEYPNRFHGRIHRLAENSVFVGADYENSVNNQRLREEQPMTMDGKVMYFHAEIPTWAREVVIDGKVSKFFVTCESKPGSLYFAYMLLRLRKEEYRWDNTNEQLTDVELAEAKTYFKPRSESVKQELDKTIEWRNLEVGNLKQLKMGGEIYTCNIEPTTVVGKAVA